MDSKGRMLSLSRPDPYGWDVDGHDGTVTVTYTLFGDQADGTYPGFDVAQAHIQPQGTFLYARGFEQHPVRVTFHRPDKSWTIATQLVPTRDPEQFTGPGMQYLFDSPTHLGAIQWRQWTEMSGARTQTIRAAVDDPAPASSIDQYADGAKKVVREAAAVFGELPAFDFGTYTFVACYRPSCHGDGMEHRNSTSVTSPRSMGGNGLGKLGTVSHEFFHAWNVKRIRPKTLEPFDYDRANLSGELWIAEGFTQYYGPLVETRAGLSTPNAFARGLGGIVNEMANAPGRHYFGPIGMSQLAPFVDAAVSVDPQNTANIFISYYTYGAGIALALDLAMRARGAQTLDDFMKVMWARHGKPEVVYTLDDTRRALSIASGDSAWTYDFWQKYIAGHELPDYGPMLERAGLLVRKTQSGAPWIGDVSYTVAGNQVTIGSPTLAGSPLYDAGLDRGDRIISVDGKEIATAADVASAVAARKPRDRIVVVFEGRAGRAEVAVTVGENPRLEVLLFEDAGRTPTAEQLAFRTRWLGSKQGN
ncbi:MAG TPA: PDZ domain-containing protein [Gemmatimonadaceae bacterium]|nr:PDZ domain-containing protein [Gemmatimonadaceae bacterium]